MRRLAKYFPQVRGKCGKNFKATVCTNSVNFAFSRIEIIGHANPLASPPFFANLPRTVTDICENPTRNTPYINYALVAANALIFIYELTLSPKAQAVLATTYGTVPLRFVHALSGHGNFEAAVLPLFTSMFLHNGPAHLLGNMLFLWIFGDNVEDFFGHFGYFFFYVFCGLASGLTHIAFNLHNSVPAVGASGAISGVLGAYMLLYPQNRILTLILPS